MHRYRPKTHVNVLVALVARRLKLFARAVVRRRQTIAPADGYWLGNLDINSTPGTEMNRPIFLTVPTAFDNLIDTTPTLITVIGFEATGVNGPAGAKVGKLIWDKRIAPADTAPNRGSDFTDAYYTYYRESFSFSPGLLARAA